MPVLFQMVQKGEDSWRIEIGQIEPGNGLAPLLREKPQQKNDAVAVTANGVRTVSAESRKVLRKIFLDRSAEEVR